MLGCECERRWIGREKGTNTVLHPHCEETVALIERHQSKKRRTNLDSFVLVFFKTRPMDAHISASGPCARAPDNPAEPRVAAAPSVLAPRPKRHLPQPVPKRATSLDSGSISRKRARDLSVLGSTPKTVGPKEGFELDIFFKPAVCPLQTAWNFIWELF